MNRPLRLWTRDDRISDFPNLGLVENILRARPLYFQGDPLEVSDELFDLAKQEMTQAMQRRGFGLPQADLAREHFLLFGVCIVKAGAHG
jgi:hypothetical protein